MAELRDVEILYPGIWNGIEFTNADIVEAVNNSNRCLSVTQPLLSLNHDKVEPEIIRHASFGAVARFALKVKDGLNVMVCTFHHVKDELASLIQDFYPRRSIEFFERYAHPLTGEVFRNVVVGVSFLGATMPPAVKGLFPDFVVSYREAAKGGVTLIIPARRKTAVMKKRGKQKFQDVPVGGDASGNQPNTPAEPDELLPTTNEFGMFLARRRAELGLTEAQVAENMTAVGFEISEQTIQDIEKGLVAPTPAVISRLADVLDVRRETLRGLMTVPSDVSYEFSESRMKHMIREVMREFQEAQASLGAYLRQIREERGMSIDDMAVLLEVTSEEIAAIEDAEIPSDELLEAFAAALDLDVDDLTARRDAMKQAIEDAEVGESGDHENGSPEEFQEHVRTFFSQNVEPLKREVDQLKRERKRERLQRDEERVIHFLENLELKHGASKLLTGERIKTLLLRADDTVPVKFSQGANAKTTRGELMSLMQDIAEIGAENVNVPRGQVTEPGQTGKDRDLNAQILRFQEKRGIGSYSRAATLYLEQQRKGQ